MKQKWRVPELQYIDSKFTQDGGECSADIATPGGCM